MAVVGLGRIGRAHADNLVARVGSAHLVRVVDRRREVARSCGRALGVPWSASWEEALEDGDVEAVVVATPVASHARLVALAATAGRHVLCEKPLAPSAAEARAAIDAAARAGVRLQVGFQLRADPDVALARARIVGGELGTVRFLRATLRDKAPPSREYRAHAGGLFLDGAVHTLDLARWLVGEIAAVTAVGAPAGAASEVDTAVLIVRFAGGAIGVLEHSRVAGYGFEFGLEVIGSRAAVRVARNRRTHLRWLTPGAVTVDHTADFLERFADAYVLELEAFGAAVRAGAPDGASGEDGLAAVELAEAAARSAATGRTVVVREP